MYKRSTFITLKIRGKIQDLHFIRTHSGRMASNVDKISILSLIRENKNVLFGRFSSDLSHEQKVEAWKDVAEKAKAMGTFSRDWKYLRDTTWQNWRKRTIEKRDNRTTTGSAGGKKWIYDEADNIIFDIIGRESPALVGLAIPEPSGSDNVSVSFCPSFEAGNVSQESIQDCGDTSVIEPICSISMDVTGRPTKELSTGMDVNKRKRIAKSTQNEFEILKKEKIRMETLLLAQKLETAKRETYKMDLELLKLEKELGLPPSNFTVDLVNKSSYIPVSNDILQFGGSSSLLENIVIVNTTENGNQDPHM